MARGLRARRIAWCFCTGGGRELPQRHFASPRPRHLAGVLRSRHRSRPHGAHPGCPCASHRHHLRSSGRRGAHARVRVTGIGGSGGWWSAHIGGGGQELASGRRELERTGSEHRARPARAACPGCARDGRHGRADTTRGRPRSSAGRVRPRGPLPSPRPRSLHRRPGSRRRAMPSLSIARPRRHLQPVVRQSRRGDRRPGDEVPTRSLGRSGDVRTGSTVLCRQRLPTRPRAIAGRVRQSPIRCTDLS